MLYVLDAERYSYSQHVERQYKIDEDVCPIFLPQNHHRREIVVAYEMYPS